MHNSIFFLLVFILLAFPATGESFDRPVTTIKTNDNGEYHAGFMYWSTIQTLFGQPAELVVLGEVENITRGQHPSSCFSGDSWRGRLRIDDVVVCPDSLLEAASKIRKIESYGFQGLAVGDTVLVFMIPYEGAYAIPCWRGSNTPIGHKFHQKMKSISCDDYEFLNLIRSGHGWDFESLSSEELRLWKCVDPEGLLVEFIRRKDMSETGSTVRIGE